MFIPIPKATILLPTPKKDNPDLKHLFIIITKPNKDNKILTVNISSCNNYYYDSTCILAKNCHSFINKKSYIAYRHSKVFSVNELNKLSFKSLEPIKDSIFNRICLGLLKSKHTPFGIKEFYEFNFGEHNN